MDVERLLPCLAGSPRPAHLPPTSQSVPFPSRWKASIFRCSGTRARRRFRRTAGSEILFVWPVDREHKPIPIERNPTTIARCQTDDADHSEPSRIDVIDLPDRYYQFDDDRNRFVNLID